MKIVTVLMLLLAATCVSCKSTSSASGAVVPCICGTAEADFSGCHHALCVKGQRNPENPECVCGPMKIGGK